MSNDDVASPPPQPEQSATPARAEPDAVAASPPPDDAESELRCTLCGLRACWTR